MQAVWKKLAEGQPVPTSRWVAYSLSVLSALGYPTLLILFGWLANLLFQSPTSDTGQRILGEKLTVGPWFQLSTSWFNSEGSLLRCAVTLIALIAAVFAFDRWVLFLSRSSALQAALYWSSNLLERLFNHARLLAVDHGLSGQRDKLRDFIQNDVLKIRESLVDWYRVFPRSVLQLLFAIVLAASIQPWLTLLAGLLVVSIWLLWTWLDTGQRKLRPVLLERKRHAQDQLMYLCESSSLLESVDSRFDVEKAFGSQLKAFNDTQLRIAAESSWRSPYLLTIAGALIAFLLFATSVRVLEPGSNMGIGETIALIGCFAIGIAAAVRIKRSVRKKRNADPSANTLQTFLSSSANRALIAGRGSPASFQHGIQFDHVCFRDSSNQRALDDVTLELLPGKFNALVSLDGTTAQALGEMVLGFGTPASGRILIDKTNLIDIDPTSICKQSLIINEKGPLLDGTLEENIWSGTQMDASVDIMDLARKANVYNAILNLPDELGTVLTNDEERLQPDQLFRIGIMRALLKKPALAVALEPRVHVSPQEEADTLQALSALKEQKTIVLLLPQRLNTLRNAERIFVFKDGKLAASGTHNQLLEQSEIYRHYNYIRFALGKTSLS